MGDLIVIAVLLIALVFLFILLEYYDRRVQKQKMKENPPTFNDFLHEIVRWRNK